MPLTLLVILAVTCIVSFMAFGNSQLMNKLILWPPAIERQREYYRLVTYGLIHADPSHLIFNMLTLFFFGRQMEPFFNGLIGPYGFALFYLGGLVISILPTYLKNRHNSSYRSLGASGAVSAVLFAFILLAPWSQIWVFFHTDAGDYLCGALRDLFDLYGPQWTGQYQSQRTPVGCGVWRIIHRAVQSERTAAFYQCVIAAAHVNT